MKTISTIKNLYQLIKNMIKIAKVLSVDDEQDIRTGYVEFLGKEQKVNIFTPYGLMHHPPKDSLSILFALQGQESNIVSMSDHPRIRVKKELKEGEVALGNYLTGSYILFDEEKDLYAKIIRDIKAEIVEDMIINVDQDISISAQNVNISSNTLTHNGTNIGSSHVHGNVSTGPNNTGGPQ